VPVARGEFRCRAVDRELPSRVGPKRQTAVEEGRMKDVRRSDCGGLPLVRKL